MHISRMRLQELLNILYRQKILQDIYYLNFFYDEPHCYSYYAPLRVPSTKRTKRFPAMRKGIHLTSGGSSFASQELALLRCLVEAIERYTTFSYPSKSELEGSYNKLKLKYDLLDPFIFTEKEKSRTITLDWIQGYDFIGNTSLFLPAETIYIHPRQVFNKNMLSIPITTGAAAGVDFETVLLNGILEVVERDAVMCAYLTKSRVPKVDYNRFPNGKLKQVIQYCIRYNLEPHVFNVTNDLQIPSFMVLMLDRTGVGPAMTVGSKSGFNVQDAITSSLEEACILRIGPRKKMMTDKTNFFSFQKRDIKDNIQRSLYWTSPTMTKHFDYLLRQAPTTMSFPDKIFSVDEQLIMIKRLFRKRNFRIYYADITLPIFKKLSYTVLRVIIPGLQPLYLNEVFTLDKKFHNISLMKKRLNDVSEYFGQSRYTLNTVPHPFP